jgi:hypothetical protein
MKRNLLVPPNGKSRRPTSRTARVRRLLIAGVVTLASVGVGLGAAAPPASADPAFSFVAVGDELSQNVMDYFASQVSGGILASYDAVNPATGVAGEVITPGKELPNYNQTNCSFARPDGSAAGFEALVDLPGCVDIARSSSPPGSFSSISSSGNYLFIPFAVDAATDATGPATATSETVECLSTTTGCTKANSSTGIGMITFTSGPTTITDAGDFTIADLQTLYADCGTVTVGSPAVTYWPEGSAVSQPAGSQRIDLYVPQSGSSTLQFWASTLGMPSTLPACDHQTIIAGPADGVAVQEDDGTALASDPDGLAPIDVAQWIAMSNGEATDWPFDARHGDLLQPIVVGTTSVPPVNSEGSMNVAGCGATFNQATCFPVTRQVYNVVSFDRVVDTGDGNYNPVLAGLFANPSSSLCQSSFTISELGFGNLPSSVGSTFADLCGSTTPTPTAGGAPTAPPVTWCENGLPTSPYSSAPSGAVTVPAGNNSAQFQNQLPANTTYWFAPGTHTDASIAPSDGDTFLGAPGAIMNGGNTIPYAFVGEYNDTSDQNVVIKYLTIEDYDPMQGGGAVNGNGNNGWTEEDDLIEYNSPGAGMMLGGDNTVIDNCLTENGEYGAQGYSFVDETAEDTFTGGADNIVFANNDVSYNNTQDTSAGIEGGVKFWQNGNVTVTGNYFHNNINSPGVWMDTDNAGFLVEDNYISNNGGEGLMYEISYNADIIDNTFIDNGIVTGPENPGFPTGAIYVSESGGNGSVPSNYAGVLNIQDNVFNDNMSGVIIYQNPNRYAGDGQDPGTLTPPTGVNIGTWINTDGPADCPGSLSETSPIDYHSLCQWRAQNVTVQDNQFTFNPSDSVYDGQCTEANSCGQNGLFSAFSVTATYPAYTVCNSISNDQDNVFSDNTYTGPWSFVYFNQGDIASWSQWTSGLTNVEGSGDNFGAQDAGSTLTS